MTANPTTPPAEDPRVDYIARYGSRCRDCADEDGVCPSSGLPCNGHRKAIRFVLHALDYGQEHGYIATARASLPAPGALREADGPVAHLIDLAWEAQAHREERDASDRRNECRDPDHLEAAFIGAAESLVDAVLALGPAPGAGVPQGWRLVPEKPTREMWAAAGDAVVNLRSRHHDALSEAVWAAMLAASPTPAAPSGELVEAARETVTYLEEVHVDSARGVWPDPDPVAYRLRAALASAEAGEVTAGAVAWSYEVQWASTPERWDRQVGFTRPSGDNVRDVTPLYAAPAHAHPGAR